MSKTFDEKNSLLKITTKFEGSEWTKYIEKARVELRKNVEIKGFRKGHAPVAEADKRIFKGDILDKALNLSIEKIYKDLIRPNIADADNVYDLNPSSIDVIKIDDNGVEIEFDFVTLPVVKTNIDYKKVGVKLDKLEPSAKDLKEVQNNLVEKYVVQEEVEDTIKNSDTVNFDFTGFVDGVEFEGGKAEGFDLVIGSKQFIAGFEDQMIGLKKGEEKDIKVRFPKDYHAQHLADKEAIFKVKINFIKRPSYPKIDEKFLQEINFEGIKTLKDFNEYVRIQALKDKIVKVQNEFIGKVIDKINKDATINIHKKLVDDEKQRMYNDFLNKLKEQQISEDEYFELTGLTKEKLLSSFEEPSTKKIREAAIMGNILEKENLYPSQKEYDAKVAELAKNINLKEDEIKHFFSFGAFANAQANENVINFEIKHNDAEGYKALEDAKKLVTKYDEARANARKAAQEKEANVEKAKKEESKPQQEIKPKEDKK